MSLFLMSFVVGCLTGLTSIGGAALMTPFLILLVGLTPGLAIGTDLVYSSFTKVAGAWMHWRQGTVDIRTVVHLASGSIPGGLVGVALIRQLRHSGLDPDPYLRRALGTVLLLVALTLLSRTIHRDLTIHRGFWQRHERLVTILWGVAVGFTVGLTSVGSGVLLAPYLLILFPLAPARAVGTDLFHAALLVSATALAHAEIGQVEWRLLPPLLAGSIPGVLMGSYLAPRFAGRTLRLAVGIVLFATGVKLV